MEAEDSDVVFERVPGQVKRSTKVTKRSCLFVKLRVASRIVLFLCLKKTGFRLLHENPWKALEVNHWRASETPLNSGTKATVRCLTRRP
jgi:hypothetical protein